MNRQQAKEILGINGSVTAEVLSKQYRVLQRKTHPDLGGSEEGFRRVQDAHEYLSQNMSGVPTMTHLTLDSHKLMEL